jgi:hypothetical protein
VTHNTTPKRRKPNAKTKETQIDRGQKTSLNDHIYKRKKTKIIVLITEHGWIHSNIKAERLLHYKVIDIAYQNIISLLSFISLIEIFEFYRWLRSFNSFFVNGDARLGSGLLKYTNFTSVRLKSLIKEWIQINMLYLGSLLHVDVKTVAYFKLWRLFVGSRHFHRDYKWLTKFNRLFCQWGC